MKLKLLAPMAFITIANISTAGIFWSKPAPKIQIASAEILIARFEKTNISYEAIKHLKIIETFAGKYFSPQEIENGLDEAFNGLWRQHKYFLERRQEGKSKFLEILLQQGEPALSENNPTE